MKAYHYVARVRAPGAPFWDRDRALWMWRELRRTFPRVLSCTVMPNHLHILIPELAEERTRLAYVLRSFSRVHGLSPDAWEPVPPPKVIVGAVKLLYEIRYIILNPNRKGYVDDSLKWEFSTHRDLVGARVDPWVRFEDVRACLGRYSGGDLAEFQRRMSVDLLGKPGGRPLPGAGQAVGIPHVPLAQVLRAVVLAAGISGNPREWRRAERALFVRLARDQGWVQGAMLARALRVVPMTVSVLKKVEVPDRQIQVGRKVLWDSRLLEPLKGHVFL